MERFVQLVVGGGLALVAGLWIAEFAAVWSSLWLFGVAASALGAAVLLAGTVAQIRY